MYRLEYFEPGQIVEVTPAYNGGGTFRFDGGEGPHTVLRPMTDGWDYYLMKGVHEDAEAAAKTRGGWDVIVHGSRIKPLIGPRRPEQGGLYR